MHARQAHARSIDPIDSNLCCSVVEYESFQDSRTCGPSSDCGCVVPTGECTVTNRLLDFLPYEVIFGIGDCRGMSEYVEVLAHPMGSCMPSPAGPATGSVEPSEPVTFCCQAGGM